jgi:hypothetical protein
MALNVSDLNLPADKLAQFATALGDTSDADTALQGICDGAAADVDRLTAGYVIDPDSYTNFARSIALHRAYAQAQFSEIPAAVETDYKAAWTELTEISQGKRPNVPKQPDPALASRAGAAGSNRRIRGRMGRGGWLDLVIFCLLSSSLLARATPVFFSMQQLTGNPGTVRFTLIADANYNPWTDGTNLFSSGVMQFTPVNGTNILNLAPIGYTIVCPGWTHTLHFVVPPDTNTWNVVNLFTNGVSPLQPIYYVMATGVSNLGAGPGIIIVTASGTNLVLVDTNVVNALALAQTKNFSVTNPINPALLPAIVVTNNQRGVALTGTFSGGNGNLTNSSVYGNGNSVTITAGGPIYYLLAPNGNSLVDQTGEIYNPVTSGPFLDTSGVIWGIGTGITGLTMSQVAGTVPLAQLPYTPQPAIQILTNLSRLDGSGLSNLVSPLAVSFAGPMVTTNAITLALVASFNGGALSNLNLTTATGTAPLATMPVAVVTNNGLANAYIARNRITSPVAQTAIYGQINTANNFGIYSNLVALVNFRPEYNATNPFDFFGNPYSMVNPQWTNGGFFCTLTNGFSMGGFGLSNFTLVVTISRQVFAPTAAAGGAGFQPNLVPGTKSLFFDVVNTNTTSGDFVDYGEYYLLHVLQRENGVWPYATNLNSLPASRELGMLGASQFPYTVTKNVYCLSCLGGTNYFWINTLPHYQPNGQQAITLPTVCTDLLQQVNFGLDTNYSGTLWNGSPTCHTNSTGVYESMMLFNVGCTPTINGNIVLGSYQMAQWPDWNQSYQVMLGDSIVAPLQTDLESPQFVQSYTNNFFYLLNSYTPANPNWMNLAQGGSSLASCLTNGAISAPFPITPVSLLPQLIMGIPITIWNDEGRNDQSTNAPSNESVINQWLTQMATPYKQLGANVFWNQIQTEPVALNNLIWNSLAGTLQGNSNIAAWNLAFTTNSVINRLFSFAAALSTNNMVIGGGVSGDGVHPLTNGAAYLALARYALGIPTDYFPPPFAGTFSGNGAGLTNVPTTGIAWTTNTAPGNASSPVFWITNAQYGGVIPVYR